MKKLTIEQKQVIKHSVKKVLKYLGLGLLCYLAISSLMFTAYDLGYKDCEKNKQSEMVLPAMKSNLLPNYAISNTSGTFNTTDKTLYPGDYYLTIGSDSQTLQINSKTFSNDNGIFETGNFFIYLPQSINAQNQILPIRQLWINAQHSASLSLPTQVNNAINYTFNIGDTLHFIVLSQMNITSISGSWSYTYVPKYDYLVGYLSITKEFMKGLDTNYLVERVYSKLTALTDLDLPYYDPIKQMDYDYMANIFGSKIEVLRDDLLVYCNNQWFSRLILEYKPVVMYYKSDLLTQKLENYIAWLPTRLYLSNGRGYASSQLGDFKGYGKFNDPIYIGGQPSYEQYIDVQVFDYKTLVHFNLPYSPFMTTEQALKTAQVDKFDIYYNYTLPDNIPLVTKYIILVCMFDVDQYYQTLDLAGDIIHTATLALTDNNYVVVSGKAMKMPFWYTTGYVVETITTSWFESMFDMIKFAFKPVFDFMSLQIAPNVSIGSLFLLPVLAGIIFAVLKIVRG